VSDGEKDAYRHGIASYNQGLSSRDVPSKYRRHRGDWLFGWYDAERAAKAGEEK
jgi:ribosome modulation factor